VLLEARMRIRRFHPSVVITLLLLPLPAVPQNTPDRVVIKAGTHIVLVNVVVKDKRGKPVGDLSRDDFVLLDNGREQKIAFFALEEASQPSTAVSQLASGPIDVHQQAGHRGRDRVLCSTN
jgi:hypothetical protein